MTQAHEQQLEAFCSIYLDNIMGAAATTTRSHYIEIRRYLRWLDDTGIDAASIDGRLADAYLDQVGIHQQAAAVRSLRYYYRFLKMMGWPGGEVGIFEAISRRKPARSPYPYYSRQQVEDLLAAPDTDSLLGLRDRTILQTLYDTGIRNTELRLLHLSDVDFDQGYLRIMGKGSKERLLPLTQPLIHWLRRWLMRRHEVLSEANPYLFVPMRHADGEGLAPSSLNEMVKKYAALAGIDSAFTTHTLRHCFASHMLENGANILAVQQLLGHEDLDSTEFYLQFQHNHLQELHRRYHPRADWPDKSPGDGQ